MNYIPTEQYQHTAYDPDSSYPAISTVVSAALNVLLLNDSHIKKEICKKLDSVCWISNISHCTLMTSCGQSSLNFIFPSLCHFLLFPSIRCLSLCLTSFNFTTFLVLSLSGEQWPLNCKRQDIRVILFFSGHYKTITGYKLAGPLEIITSLKRAELMSSCEALGVIYCTPELITHLILICKL